MARISDLSDELLLKILSFLPTKEAVSTSVLSKQWEFLWMWLPELKFEFTRSKYACLRDFIAKNLPIHKAPIIESLRLRSIHGAIQPEDLDSWVGTAVSRCVRELSISTDLYYTHHLQPFVSLPCSLYSCNSLVTLNLCGRYIFVDVPPTVCLPCLKTLQLEFVAYSHEDSLPLLLSYCPALENLSIDLEESINYDNVLLPCSLYSLKSLVTLKLQGGTILVDVPRTVCLPSLKTLQLRCVTYPNDESLRLLLSHCPVLEDLMIDYDNLRKLVIIVPSLQRLSLCLNADCSSDGCVIVTPCLKSFDVVDQRCPSPYLIEHMPELEEASIILTGDTEKDTERLLKSITNVKRLSLSMTLNSGKGNVYPDGIVFSQLETLELYICSQNWSKLLVNLLKDSPNLRVLHLVVDHSQFKETRGEYEPVSSSNNQGSVPTCFLNSLETFKFEGYNSVEQEDRDLLSFIFKHACCLKSTSVVHK
ncbi:PREDICTED: putative FBD-associated F-box protein At5g56700 [Camelina sativa]|uniref:FBD-associated F-box protein At5g56700 n=1 Tax=Camelina sativa TaxID=90675 RepID=A0ABM0W5A2_CAMSA|nr:PREDICTED: putative FBD-associated F-box protein At5g56700 [Camelina sativa]